MSTRTLATTGTLVVLAATGGALVATVAGSDRASSSAAAPAQQRVALPDTPAPLPAADSARTTDAKAVYERVKGSVAEIRASTSEGESTGTGFVVSADGLAVTNAHVVGDAQEVAVRLGTGGGTLQAQVLGTAPDQDLAVLQLSGGQALTPLKLASGDPQVGDAVYALGSPFGLAQTFTSGIVSATGRQIQAPDGSPIDGVIQTDAAINPGNSGGPLLNGDGEVVGVNSQIASPSGANNGIGFAIPARTVATILDQASSASQAMGVTPQQRPAPADGTQPALTEIPAA